MPEDRKQYGLNLAGSIKDNIAVTQWDSISKMGFVNKKEENELGAAMVEKLGIKIGSPNHPASSLSGGNQQKIVLAKWVSHDLDILILDEPTRGVDAVSYTHLDVYKRQREGSDITIVSWSMMTQVAMQAAGQLAEKGISAEVVDLRSLVPLDKETILNSISKTHRLAIVQEAVHTSGFASEIAAIVAEECLDELDENILRITAPDCPVPYSPVLEDAYVPGPDKVADMIAEIF